MSKLEHEPCLPSFLVACALHIWLARKTARRFCIDVAAATTKLTEDPPFGGLWCDQPALFLPALFTAALTPATHRAFPTSEPLCS